MRPVVAIGLLLLAFVASLAAPSAEADPATRRIVVGGLTRSYLVHRPAGPKKAEKRPLVVMLHGGFGTAEQAARAYGWNAKADEAGFVVAYPVGIGRAWNAGGRCCGRPVRDDIDDVGFLTAMINTLVATENIDPRRVYLAGMSNGAAMVYRYACTGTYPVAAYGSVAGAAAVACRHPHRVSLMEIHGIDDQNIPVAGGFGRKGIGRTTWRPLAETIANFRTAAHCRAPKITRSGPVQRNSALCDAGRTVDVITIDGAGHQWPGAAMRHVQVARFLTLDPPSKALDATDTLWAFFSRHGR